MSLHQFQLLVDVQREKEEKLQAQFVQAQQFLLQQQQKYQGLADYRTDYIRQSQQKASAGIQSRQFNQYLNFITKLDTALTQQQQQIMQAEKVVAQRKQTWLAQQKKRKALESLIAKEMALKQQKAAKQEQKMLDEIATLQFFRRLQQSS
jgi:flagellar FliJ protein